MKLTSLLKRPVIQSALISLGLFSANTAQAADAIADCVLREAPFSLQLPAYDVMTRPEARAIAEQYYPGLFETLPAWLLTPPIGPSSTVLCQLRQVARLTLV